MTKLALAIALVALAGCAAPLDTWFYQRYMAGDPITANDKAKPDSPREPAHDDDPYRPRRR